MRWDIDELRHSRRNNCLTINSQFRQLKNDIVKKPKTDSNTEVSWHGIDKGRVYPLPILDVCDV